jgi:hypothetical protein
MVSHCHRKDSSRIPAFPVLSMPHTRSAARIMAITEIMNRKKTSSWILLGILSLGLALPSYADKVPSQKAQLRAAQKMQRRQDKANRKYAKAQRKAERRMIKKDRKNTHLPGQRK